MSSQYKNSVTRTFSLKICVQIFKIISMFWFGLLLTRGNFSSNIKLQLFTYDGYSACLETRQGPFTFHSRFLIFIFTSTNRTTGPNSREINSLFSLAFSPWQASLSSPNCQSSIPSIMEVILSSSMEAPSFSLEALSPYLGREYQRVKRFAIDLCHILLHNLLVVINLAKLLNVACK